MLELEPSEKFILVTKFPGYCRKFGKLSEVLNLIIGHVIIQIQLLIRCVFSAGLIFMVVYL